MSYGRRKYKQRVRVAKRKSLKKRAAKRLGVGVEKLGWRDSVLVFVKPVDQPRSHRPRFGEDIPVPQEYLTPYSA